MNNQCTVVDNFLSIDEFKKIHDMMYREDFAWFYHSDVADLNENTPAYFFTHIYYWKHEIYSPFFKDLAPIFSIINPNALIRVKANLYPNVNKFFAHNTHTDFPFPHRGAIFYINTNNGKTILKDGLEIDSVSNRMLFFDPSTVHQSTTCTDDKCRINIAFNYF